jgi:hypothetical protein
VKPNGENQSGSPVPVTAAMTPAIGAWTGA